MNTMFTIVRTNLAACAKGVRLNFYDVVLFHHLRADIPLLNLVPVDGLQVWALKSPEDLSNEARCAIFDEEGNLDFISLALKTSKGVSCTCIPPNVLLINVNHDLY